MLSDLLVEFSVDGSSSCSVDDAILGFVRWLPLDLCRDRVLHQDPPNGIVSGLDSIVKAGHVRALVPYISDENNVRQCRVIPEFMKHPEVSSGGPSGLAVRHAVEVDDSSELRPFLVSVERFNPEDQETDTDMRSRGGQAS